jgi:hypothetical protein
MRTHTVLNLPWVKIRQDGGGEEGDTNAVYCVHLLYNFCIRKIITFPAELLIILAYSHLLCPVACVVYSKMYIVQFTIAAFLPKLYENRVICFKGTVRPDWICIRLVPLDRP